MNLTFSLVSDDFIPKYFYIFLPKAMGYWRGYYKIYLEKFDIK